MASIRDSANELPRFRAVAGDLPLADLAPEQFHRLILHLLDDRAGFVSVENHGQVGDDRGIDILAVRRVSGEPGESSRVLIQVKRTARFTKTSATTELARLGASRDVSFDVYVLATTGTVSAAALRTLRAGLQRLGIKSFEVWDRALLTVRLHERPWVMRAFFVHAGPEIDPAVSTWIDGASTRPVVVLWGSRSFEPMTGGLRGVGPVMEQLVDLVERGVVRRLVCTGPELRLAAAIAARDPSLVDKTLVTAPAHEGAESLKKAVDAVGADPAVAVLFATEEELDAVATVASRSTAGPVLALRTATAPSPLVPSLWDELSFISHMASATRDDWLRHHCTKLSFDGAPDFEELVAGHPATPGIVHTGSRPSTLDDDAKALLRDGRCWITGGSGTGKTVRAFFLGHAVDADATWLLDLARVPPVAVSDVAGVIEWLEGHGRSSVLILDNAHTVEGLRDELGAILDTRRRRSCSVIAVETVIPTRYTYRRVAAGGSFDFLDAGAWEKAPDFTAWAKAAAPARYREAVDEAARLARNEWHFMFLLRGGKRLLHEELRTAASAAGAHALWFAVAAWEVFKGRAPTLAEVHSLISSAELWPATLPVDQRTAWVATGLDHLAATRLVVAGPTAYATRHPLEATGIVRMLYHEPYPSVGSFRSCCASLLQDALGPPIEVPAQLIEDHQLTKLDVRSYAREVVQPRLHRQAALEQALPADAALQVIVDETWAPLMRAMEKWSVHTLYWLVTGVHYQFVLTQFSPFNGMSAFAGLERIDGESDAVDVDYFVRAWLANEATYALRFLLRRELYARRVEGFVATLRSMSEIQGMPADRAHLQEDIDEWVERLAEVRTEIAKESVALPALPPVAGPVLHDELCDDILEVEMAKPLLEAHRRRFRQIATGASVEKIRNGLATVSPSARAFVLFDLAVLAPGLPSRVLDGAPSEWRDDFEERVAREIGRRGDMFFSFGSADLYVAPAVADLAATSDRVQAAVDALGASAPLALRVQIAQTPNALEQFSESVLAERRARLSRRRVAAS